MRKYNKPTVEVVNLKSSESIARTFDSIQDELIKQELGLASYGGKNYTASKYAITASVLKAAEQSDI